MSHAQNGSLKEINLSVAGRLMKVIRSDGIVGTLGFLRKWLLFKAHYHLYDKSFEKFEAHRTARAVRAVDLDYKDELKRHAVEYLATPRLLVHKAIGFIAEPLDDFTFIDIGSGLGRPLLVAAEYPFKAVIGYELSPSLHLGAVANIERTQRALALPCHDAKSINENALEADWPHGSRIFFLFNPFDREFMLRFLQRVHATEAPGTLHYLVFLNLKHQDLLERFPFERCSIPLLRRAVWQLMSPYPLHIYCYRVGR